MPAPLSHPLSFPFPPDPPNCLPIKANQPSDIPKNTKEKKLVVYAEQD